MSTNSNSPEPTTEELQEFFVACRRHDWYYVYADDSRSYREGSNNEDKLRRKAESHIKYKEIFNAWAAYMFSGKTFVKEQQPEPTIPE